MFSTIASRVPQSSGYADDRVRNGLVLTVIRQRRHLDLLCRVIRSDDSHIGALVLIVIVTDDIAAVKLSNGQSISKCCHKLVV